MLCQVFGTVLGTKQPSGEYTNRFHGNFYVLNTAAAVDHATRMTQDTDNLLQLFHLAVFQFWGIEFDFIEIVHLNGGASMTSKFCKNTSIINELPLLAVWVVDMIGIITTVMGVTGMKMFSQRLRSLLAG